MIAKVKCKTLEIVWRGIIEAETIEQARVYGEARHGASGYFVGAQSMTEKK